MPLAWATCGGRAPALRRRRGRRSLRDDGLDRRGPALAAPPLPSPPATRLRRSRRPRGRARSPRAARARRRPRGRGGGGGGPFSSRRRSRTPPPPRARPSKGAAPLYHRGGSKSQSVVCRGTARARSGRATEGAGVRVYDQATGALLGPALTNLLVQIFSHDTATAAPRRSAPPAPPATRVSSCRRFAQETSARTRAHRPATRARMRPWSLCLLAAAARAWPAEVPALDRACDMTVVVSEETRYVHVSTPNGSYSSARVSSHNDRFRERIATTPLLCRVGPEVSGRVALVSLARRPASRRAARRAEPRHGRSR